MVGVADGVTNGVNDGVMSGVADGVSTGVAIGLMLGVADGLMTGSLQGVSRCEGSLVARSLLSRGVFRREEALARSFSLQGVSCCG